MEVRWLEDALRDVRNIRRHIAADSPQAAGRMVGLIRDAASALASLEDRGRPGRWPGTRELIVTGAPYIIPYRGRDGVIEILRVLHGARTWPQAPE